MKFSHEVLWLRRLTQEGCGVGRRPWNQPEDAFGFEFDSF
jgi:hypothetical protein